MHIKLKALLCATLGCAILSPVESLASSHAAAPFIAGRPRVDGTDFYMFRSFAPGRSDFVTFLANYIPLQVPNGGPTYYTLDRDGLYQIHIDNDGDAVEDLTFSISADNNLTRRGQGIALDVGGERVPIPLRQSGPITRLFDTTVNERESFRLSLIRGDRRSRAIPLRGGRPLIKPIDNIGEKTLPDYSSYAASSIKFFRFPGCREPGRVFVGQRGDAFAINLGEIFDLVNFVPIEAGAFPGGIEQDRANEDIVGRYNVTTIALEVPIACVTGSGNGVIGAWTTSSLPRVAVLNETPTFQNEVRFLGPLVQQSRVGHPLVNEVVIGLPDKNAFNSGEPADDGRFAFYVTTPTFPALLDALFRDAVNGALGTSLDNLAPATPRNDLVATFLTGIAGLNQQATVTPSEMLRLNTAIPPTGQANQSPLGVLGGDLAGFPNGRRPGDDVVDITLRVAMGRLCHPLPIGNALGQPSNDFDLGLCRPQDAPVGTVPFTDGAPLSALELPAAFPYLNDPIPGSPDEATFADQG